MQLFVHITPQEESVTPIFTKMLEAGFHGASVVDCQGMLTTLSACNADDAPIFGSLRQFINPCRQTNKMILIVLKDEDVPKVKEIIHTVAGDLRNPNTGIFFTVPVMNWEGVSHK